VRDFEGPKTHNTWSPGYEPQGLNALTFLFEIPPQKTLSPSACSYLLLKDTSKSSLKIIRSEVTIITERSNIYLDVPGS